MAILTVTTSADKVANDGKLSLREAVAQANATSAANTIRFASGLEGKTLVLTQGELTIKQDVTIDGDQNNDGKEVTLSGGGASRILHIVSDFNSYTDATMRDLTFTGGHVEGQGGGAILADVSVNLTLIGSTIAGNDTSGNYARGGGILADYAALSLIGCVVHNNSTSGNGAAGGGIACRESIISLTNSDVSGNQTTGTNADGGGIFGWDAVILTNSTVSDNSTTGNNSRGGGIFALHSVMLDQSTVSHNSTTGEFADGGGISSNGNVTLTDSSISDNTTEGGGASGGGLFGRVSVTLANSTVSGNSTAGYFARGGGIYAALTSFYDPTRLTLSDSTVSGNSTRTIGGGVFFDQGSATIADSIIVGNGAGVLGPDIVGAPIDSNGHNIFGSDVDTAILGDLQGIAPGLIFASLDPATGGGRLNAAGIVPLRNSLTNPALSGGDPLAALPTDQLGHVRPQPAGSLPDIGASERNQALSTTPSDNNDVLTGTDGGDDIRGKAGADLILGRGGNDSMHGEGGSDVLDGGNGNDTLDGGDGIDLARFGGSTAVAVDLVAGTAKRGGETDKLSSIQGAIGSSAGDTFEGDAGPNWFLGGAGPDRGTGGAGRDLYDFNAVADSPAGSAGRDVIGDLAPQSDRLDLTGIDADTTRPGDQAFRFVGTHSMSTTPGVLGFTLSAGNTIIRGSVDTDPAPEFGVQLTGLTGIGGYVFYL